MADEGKPEKDDPRETPAFRAVVKQLEEQKKQAAELAAQLASLNSEREAHKLESEKKALEEKGLYEQALGKAQSDWQKKLAEREAELAKLRADYEVSQIESALVGAGVVGRARSYLARDYASLGSERPEISSWVESLKGNPEYAGFFAAPAQAEQRVSRPGDGAGRAAGASKAATDWASVRADIASGDPRKAGPASKLMTQYILEHGAPPPKE